MELRGAGFEQSEVARCRGVAPDQPAGIEPRDEGGASSESTLSSGGATMRSGRGGYVDDDGVVLSRATRSVP